MPFEPARTMNQRFPLLFCENRSRGLRLRCCFGEASGAGGAHVQRGEGLLAPGGFCMRGRDGLSEKKQAWRAGQLLITAFSIVSLSFK